MIEALLILLLFQLIGEGLRSWLHLPVPGPVIGLFLLAALRVATRGGGAAETASPLEATARTLVRHMGLLFVPAGVGVVATAGLIAPSWAPIALGLVGSTVLGLLATGWTMHALLAVRQARR